MTDQPSLDFQDDKEPDALRTIGEVAKAFGIKQHVLRYWEEQFPQLKPLTRAGGRRYYRPEDVELIQEISRLLYQEGYTIRGARHVLGGRKRVAREGATQPDAGQSQGGRADAALVRKLQNIRADLAAALAAAG
ncbi:MerR family transcriptional regulator [Novosphingobium sp. ZN18A2]|uniref:MerR family transcriptional regulator n=1 Tax=Novosphingobium sp. ZN18A2 TaxID=3079861 RepID=UPI0030D5B26E